MIGFIIKCFLFPSEIYNILVMISSSKIYTEKIKITRENL